MAKPEKDPQAAAAFPVHMPFAESPWLEAEIERRPELSEDERRLLRDYARDGLAVLPGVAPDELIEGIRREVSGLFNPGVEEGPASYYRRQDAWETSSAVRDLALSPRVLAALELLYGRRAFPFQTLNFLFGSQQENHSDAILFNSLPPRFMCGVWVALEDVTEDNGPLFYYPGSHRLPQLYPEDFALGGQTPDEFFNTRYGSYLSELMRARGLERQVFLPKRGDALIWASNIVHGGTPRRDPERTRWSQVTHYFFADCICYVPLYSVPAAGEYFLRDVKDFRGEGLVPQTYNGHAFQGEPARGGRSHVRFDRDLSIGASIAAAAFPEVLGPADPLAGLVRLGVASPGLPCHLDELGDHDDALTLVGWAAASPPPGMDARAIRISLESERGVYLLDTKRMLRQDVADAFGAGREQSGFRTTLDKEDLPPGTYRLGVVVSGGGEPQFAPFGRTFEVRG